VLIFHAFTKGTVMGALSGKTIVITGGTRGIGFAIGLRFAQEGANIVTMDSEQLRAESAEQLAAAGGKTVSLTVDVRDEESVKTALDKAISQFGGIDTLVNNVSAFCFADTVDIAPEQFDNLFSVNVRATFMLSRACHPHLKKASNPHIINISPPLDMNARWFKQHLSFTMSKFGMSMCTLGMAADFKGVAVNSLWPMTTIATSTIKDHFKPEVYAGSRWPAIMADAAWELLRRNARDCTGNFFIDELLLREAGVTDFKKYAVDPNAPLMLDLFIPDNLTDKSSGVTLTREMFTT
jgi:citronellol/citronellal dehydrogenase